VIIEHCRDQRPRLRAIASRPARRGLWNAGLDDMLAEARAAQYDRGAAERSVGPDAYRWRPSTGA